MSSSGRILYEGRDRTHLRPYDVAALGIARTFQNVALFKGMTTLDNIMTGRVLHMRSHLLSQALYWGPALREEEVGIDSRLSGVIDFLEIEAIRKTPVGKFPYGLQKRVELGRALPQSPSCSSLTNPWRA